MVVMNGVKKNSVLAFFVGVFLVTGFSSLHSAVQQLIPNLNQLIDQSLSFAPAVKSFLDPYLTQEAMNSVVKGQAFPLVIGTAAYYMKKPYILICVAEGVAIAYFLAGSQVAPASMGAKLIASFQENAVPLIKAPVVEGVVSALVSTVSIKLVGSEYSGFVKPLIVGGAIVGAAMACFLPNVSDEQKALAYGSASAAIMPVMQPMIDIVSQSAQGAISFPKIDISEMTPNQKKGGAVAVALIALGGLATTIHALHAGDLSPETQMLAGVTIAQALAMGERSAVYEYGYRGAKKVVDVGANIVSQINFEPIKERARRLVNGVFNAFGWAGDSLAATSSIMSVWQ